TLALSRGAKLVILDGPTGGVDPVARGGLMDRCQELVEDGNISILLSTHITSELGRCADFITSMKDGRVINSSAKEEYVASYRLLNGNQDQLNQVKEKLIAYKINSFGFTGLIHSRDFDESSEIKTTTPNLEEIMVYFAKEENLYV